MATLQSCMASDISPDQQPMTVVLALLLGCGAVSASSAPAARVTFWWKPSNASSIAADVAGMRSFSATDVNLYCGYAALADGTFGVDPRPEGGWGDPTLCQEAVSVATHAGLGVQLVVEGRFDEPCPLTIALKKFGELDGYKPLATCIEICSLASACLA